MDSSWAYALMTIVGPILLLVALAWVMIRNRQSKIPKEVSDAGSRRVYAEEERRRREGTDDAED